MPINPKDIDVSDYDPGNDEEEEVTTPEGDEAEATPAPEAEVTPPVDGEAAPAPEGQPAEGTQPTPQPKFGKFGDDADKVWKSYQELESLVGSKFNGLTWEQIQEIQGKAQKFDQIAGGLPPAPTAGSPTAQPSKAEVKDLIKASGLDFSNIDWDNLDSAGFGKLLQESLQKMGSHLLTTMPAVIQQHQEAERADWEEIQAGAQLDPRLDSDTIFRDRVADKIEIAMANGKELTVPQAVALVQEEYRAINAGNNQNARLEADKNKAEETNIKAGATDIVPKSGGGSKPLGEKPKTARDAINESVDELGHDFGDY